MITQRLCILVMYTNEREVQGSSQIDHKMLKVDYHTIDYTFHTFKRYFLGPKTNYISDYVCIEFKSI